MLTIVLVCFVAMLGAGMAKKSDATLAMAISVTACIYVMMIAVSRVSGIAATLYGIFESLELGNEYFELLMKITGLAYVGELGGALCKDAGHQVLAEQIALVAKLTILGVSMPILLQLVEVILQFA